MPTARRMARPDVGEPSGTFAVTITLVPRCSIWSISCARPPAPHASMAASSALLGSAPTSVSFLCRCSCCQCGGCCNDGHFVGTPPPSKLTLKVMRSMGACVGSNGTNGAPSTGQRSRRTRPPISVPRFRTSPRRLPKIATRWRRHGAYVSSRARKFAISARRTTTGPVETRYVEGADYTQRHRTSRKSSLITYNCTPHPSPPSRSPPARPQTSRLHAGWRVFHLGE